MKKIRVLIAEDHTLVREGLRLLLEKGGDFQVVGEAGDGHEAVELSRRLAPDVVLMDIGMPRLTGLEATKQIVRENPQARVLVLTVHETEDYFFRVLEAGARGFLVKTAAPTDLASAVRAVYEGGAFLYPSLAKKLVEEYLRRVGTGEERASYDKLTDRERQVLRLIGEGHTNQEIAAQLGLSVNTVQTHRTHVMDKLNLHSRAELMKYAVRLGLIRQPT